MTGKQIQTIRLRLGLTQAELAEKLGVARNTVTRWESETIGIKESAARLLQLLAKETASRRG
jgi:DNA-binding transcriptional regulator YiaG